MSEQALDLLLRLTLLLSLAVLLLALLRPLLLRGLGASAAYLAWLLVPLMLLSPWLPQLPQQGLTPLADVAPALMMSAESAEPAPARLAPRAPLPPGAHAGVLALWLAGVLTLGLMLARRQRRFSARLRHEGQDLRAPAGASPALLGIWRARLVLPLDFETRFDAEERRLILAHEAVHARRHDNAWNLLAAALLALQWFNPLAWWALGRMRADQELACDAVVLNQLGEKNMSTMMKTYLSALLKSCPAQRMPVLANGWAHQHPLLERVRLLGRHRRSVLRRRLGGFAALALCTGAALLARAEQPDAPAATTAAAGLGVILHLDAQPDRQDARHSQLQLELPAPGPASEALGKRMNLPQGDWCLGLLPHGIPGGTARPLAQLMDARCQTALTDWVAVPVGRGRYSLSARLGQQELLVRVGLEWVDPKDPRIPAEMQREAQELAVGSARQQAQLEQQRAQLAAAVARQRRSGAAATPATRDAAPVATPSSVATAAPVATPAPAASTAALPASVPIRLALDLEVIERSETSSRRLQAKPVLLLAPGSIGTMRLPMHRISAQGKPSEGEADDTLELQLSARDLGEGLLMIESQLRLVGADRPLASPRLRVREGERARIETGQSVGSDVRPFIRLDLVATRDQAPQP